MGNRTINMTTGSPAKRRCQSICGCWRNGVVLLVDFMDGGRSDTRISYMSRIAINWIGADALFIAEPASWLVAMLCVFLPYFNYRRKYLE